MFVFIWYEARLSIEPAAGVHPGVLLARHATAGNCGDCKAEQKISGCLSSYSGQVQQS